MSEQSLVPELRFPTFNTELVSSFIKEIAEEKLSNGLFNDPSKVGSGYFLINVKDMFDGIDIKKNNLTQIDVSKTEFKKNKVRYGDIFFTRSSLVKEGIAHSSVCLLADDDLTFDGHLVRLRPKKNKISPLYFAYLLKTSYLRKQLVSRGKTGTMTTIGQSDIESVKFYLPNLLEQQKIASFLSAVDQRIALLEKKKGLLEQYKKGVMQKLFSQEIRFKKEDGSEFEEWEEKKLGEVLSKTSTGLNPRNNFKLGKGGNYYVTIKNIENGAIDFGSCEMIDDDALKQISKRSTLRKGDLIMSSIGNIGEAYLLDQEPFNWNINESVFMLRPTNMLLPIFLYYIITNDYSKWYFENNSTGSSFKSIKKGTLKEMPVSIPSASEQRLIAGFLEAIDTNYRVLNKKLFTTQIFKKGLLQKMFV